MDMENNSIEAQRGRLLATLKQRPLTTLQARSELNVMHPAGRVMELRASGYEIQMDWVMDCTPEGRWHRVGKYTLCTLAVS